MSVTTKEYGFRQVVRVNLGTANKPVYAPTFDNAYGPYNSLEDAWAALSADKYQKCLGKTVGILKTGDDNKTYIAEYWFESAFNSINDLVPKNNPYEIMRDAMFYKGLIDQTRFNEIIIDPSAILANSCFITADNITIPSSSQGVPDTKILKDSLMIWNGSSWDCTDATPAVESALADMTCTDPVIEPSTQYASVDKIMEWMDGLDMGGDDRIVTVGALKKVLVHILGHTPIIEDVE